MPQEIQLPTTFLDFYFAGFIVAVLIHWVYGREKAGNLPLMYLITTFVCQSWLHWALVSVFLLVGMMVDAIHNAFR